MRAVFGLLLIMLGLAMAVVWMPEHHSERQLAVVTEIATKGVTAARDLAPADDKAARSFSPRTPLIVAPPPQHVVRSATSASVQTTLQPSLVTASAGVMPDAKSAGVAQSSVGTSSVVRMPDTPVRSVDPDVSRDELARAIQRELKRVGCYWGDVDGSWGTGSRRAMAAFTDRVNASLPIDQPDFVLLTLVRGHQGTACGKGCPPGQAYNDTGRCVAPTVSARRPSDRRVAGLTQELREEPAATTASATTQVPSVPLSAASGGTLAAAAATAGWTQRNATPLPGRMSIGGPNVPASALAPPPPSAARDAVQELQQPASQPRATSRDRMRPHYRRSAASRSRGGQGYPVPSVSVYRGQTMAYRAPPQRYYAPPRRTASRSWTATFFANQP